MKSYKKILAMLLILVMTVCAAGCADKGAKKEEAPDQVTEAVKDDTTQTAATQEPVATDEPKADTADKADTNTSEGDKTDDNAGNSDADIPAQAGTDINIAVLAGPTGIGAVGLMEANDAKSTVNNYNFTVVAANDQIVAGLTSGEYDIAAIATNVASNLYNKTSGGIRICALNTYGVLYILENGDSVNSISDLAGKTIYSAGQGANPEYVLEYLISKAGLTYSTDGSDADVKIEFGAADQIVAGMASGEYSLCMLPVPAVTSVLIQNKDVVRKALDMTAEWNSSGAQGQLTMGCIAVRAEFADAHPEAVAAFLKEYAASIDAVKGDPAHAGELCEQYGVVAKAAVATKAIPDCNLCCITGDDVRATIEPYYEVLFNANPQSIGGALPGDDFYVK